MLWNQKRKTMNKLELFKKMMSKAKANGYKGDDYKYQTGFILDGDNINSVIFRNDFASAIWNERGTYYTGDVFLTPIWETHLKLISDKEDKWKYLEENVKFNN